MITLRKFEQIMMQQRTDYLCSDCGHWSAYFINIPPVNCDACKETLPNLEGLLNKQKERRKYHFKDI